MVNVEKIAELVERFVGNLDAYRSGKYKEDRLLACPGIPKGWPFWDLNRRIAATDTEIDNLVYELYGLTEEEIRIVEGAG